MQFETLGDAKRPAILFFHAMGVTGASSEPVAKNLQARYFCILPTSTVYCAGQKYVSKADEVRQVETFLRKKGVERLALVVASSIGADLAAAFLAATRLPVEHVFFDGGQFAQIGRGTRRVMTPFLYLAIKSLYWSKGKTLKKIMWCDDDAIKPYFIAAGKALTYGNLRRQLADSLENQTLPGAVGGFAAHGLHSCEFGGIEDHFKYRDAVHAGVSCRGIFPCLNRMTTICSSKFKIRRALRSHAGKHHRNGRPARPAFFAAGIRKEKAMKYPDQKEHRAGNAGHSDLWAENVFTSFIRNFTGTKRPSA